jgi:DNA repair protein RadC
LTLDTRNRIIGLHEISRGNLNTSVIHPREIFQRAILNNANSIILFHNHPSGDCEPSADDIQTTKLLAKAGKLMGIPVLDHLVIGDSYCSMSDKNMMGVDSDD